MPIKKGAAYTVRVQGARQREARDRIAAIVARREQLVAELGLLRDCGEASKLVYNAQQLLTRWWSSASWKAREELLKNAEWLLRLEKCRAEQLPARS